MDLVYSLLYRQASFVLIDKHTYVTLLYRFDVLRAHLKHAFYVHRRHCGGKDGATNVDVILTSDVIMPRLLHGILIVHWLQ